jgi:hypothetical protein
MHTQSLANLSPKRRYILLFIRCCQHSYTNMLSTGCAAIGGGQHYFDEAAGGTCSCVSLGGLAFRRVWVEAMQQCCASRGFPLTISCNSYCGTLYCDHSMKERSVHGNITIEAGQNCTSKSTDEFGNTVYSTYQYDPDFNFTNIIGRTFKASK